MIKPVVTAVGRVLKPKHGEPRRHQVIKIDPDGSSRIVVNKTLDNA